MVIAAALADASEGAGVEEGSVAAANVVWAGETKVRTSISYTHS